MPRRGQRGCRHVDEASTVGEIVAEEERFDRCRGIISSSVEQEIEVAVVAAIARERVVYSSVRLARHAYRHAPLRAQP